MRLMLAKPTEAGSSLGFPPENEEHHLLAHSDGARLTRTRNVPLRDEIGIGRGHQAGVGRRRRARRIQADQGSIRRAARRWPLERKA